MTNPTAETLRALADRHDQQATHLEIVCDFGPKNPDVILHKETAEVLRSITGASRAEQAGDDEEQPWIGYPTNTAPAPPAVAPNGKLVGWWNGTTDNGERDGIGWSVRWGADAEDSNHDIPLYDGYNPIHYVTPPAVWEGDGFSVDDLRSIAWELRNYVPEDARTVPSNRVIAMFDEDGDRSGAYMESLQAQAQELDMGYTAPLSREVGDAADVARLLDALAASYKPDSPSQNLCTLAAEMLRRLSATPTQPPVQDARAGVGTVAWFNPSNGHLMWTIPSSVGLKDGDFRPLIFGDSQPPQQVAVYQCPRCATSLEVDPTAKPQQADGGAVDYKTFAEFLISIGWHSTSDAQWSRLEKAMPEISNMFAHPPKSPVVSVDDAMVERAIAAFTSTESGPYGEQTEEKLMRAALIAAIGGVKP